MDLESIVRLATPHRMAELRLQSDPYWNKINAEKQQFYRNEALRYGQIAIDKYRELHSDATIQALCSEYRVTVKYADVSTESPVQPMVHSSMRRITIDRDHLLQTIEWLQSIGLAVTQNQWLMAIVLRGFYPFFAERHQILPSESLPNVHIKQLGFLRSEEPITHTDLAAADYFCSVLAHLPFPIGLMPYVKWIESGHTTPQELLQLLQSEEVNT